MRTKEVKSPVEIAKLFNYEPGNNNAYAFAFGVLSESINSLYDRIGWGHDPETAIHYVFDSLMNKIGE